MLKKYISFLFIFTAAVLLISFAQPALALEVTYPQIGDSTITSESGLLDYLQYFFLFSIAISGILGVMSIVFSGIQIMLAAGNPQAISESRERIFGAILGIALLLAAFIILRSINPALLNPSTTALPSQDPRGVLLETVFAGIVVKTETAPINNPTITAPRPIPINILPEGIIRDGVNAALRLIFQAQIPNTIPSDRLSYRIRYSCNPPANGIEGQALLVWGYNLPNYEIDRARNGIFEAGGVPQVDTYRLRCNTNQTNYFPLVIGGSYAWKAELPGVYFYLNPPDANQSCWGISSEVYTDRSIIYGFDDHIVDDLGQTQDQTPKCIRIVNSRQQQFGVVLNEEETNQGECTYPIMNKNVPAGVELVSRESKSIPATAIGDSANPKYAYVFQHAAAPANGTISFNSDRLFVRLGANDFNHVLYGDRAYRLPDEYDDVSGLIRSVAGNVDNRLNRNLAPAATECNTPNDCLKSTKSVNGSYRVILYAGNEENWSNEACQMYTCQENNFRDLTGAVGGFLGDVFAPINSNRWIYNSQRKLYDMYVIPMPAVACASS